ncbi:prenyltransferase/squalene oxidase repeat-containing protein [Planctomyces sp. SH-PL14]|uniref:prenyltransferase/squalene oxidase repeat-containing protein n=1 Tax=Planctomyces sp. SH-PL14 TaxID=1632864 RepID=UPI00078C7BA7|nr:prenyltransferase/squalene oxidase repeat-containing protein [Planctomyces sp. SH-PL14]AMV22118.1 hypothetical protein VT03_29715 [Planctomyces sp. SH-PL14]
MSQILSFGQLILTFCLVAGLAQAQTPDKAEEARLKGYEFLKSQQLEDGSWEYAGHDVGITALCGLALIENGLPISDPIVESAQRYVVKNYQDVKQTYDITLAILFLSRVGDRDNRKPIRDLAARLIAGQNVDGGWHYTCPAATQSILVDSNERIKPQAGKGDNSCTQFAVLGLWVASRWGVNIDIPMLKVAERFVATQRPDGGWPYQHEDKPKEEEGNSTGTPAPTTSGTEAESKLNPSSPSMTFAGLFCLTVARATRIRAELNGVKLPKPKAPPTTAKKPRTNSARATDPMPAPMPMSDEPASNLLEVVDPGEKAKTLKEDPVFAKGLERAGLFAGSMSPGSARYFLWSVERMGVLLGQDKFGNTDWFNKGSTALITSQSKEGGWVSGEEGKGTLPDTAFAILFLRKANLGSDISRLLEGEPAKAFSVASKAGERFGSLADAIKGAKEGDVIRIDGSGPYDMPHLEIDKDLTIVAGTGYIPTFRYDIGYNADGKRSRPEDDREVRHMIRVNKGHLTMEGLALQMDAPVKNVSFSAVVINGGTLRMLNCIVSEANKMGMAAVRVTSPGEVTVRNSMLVGGRTGVEVLTGGKQKILIDNTLLFSTACVSVFNGPKPEDADCQLHLSRCAAYGTDIFNFRGLTTPISIQSDGVAYKGDWLGSSMLPAVDSHKGVNWQGTGNLFDVMRWVGSAGKQNMTVVDAKKFNSFFGVPEENGAKQTITFAAKRPLGAFNHAVRADDFEFSNTSNVFAYRRKAGLDAIVVGPGEGYLRFRESFDYRTWNLVATAP